MPTQNCCATSCSERRHERMVTRCSGRRSISSCVAWTKPWSPSTGPTPSRRCGYSCRWPMPRSSSAVGMTTDSSLYSPAGTAASTSLRSGSLSWSLSEARTTTSGTSTTAMLLQATMGATTHGGPHRPLRQVLASWPPTACWKKLTADHRPNQAAGPRRGTVANVEPCTVPHRSDAWLMGAAIKSRCCR